MISKKAVDLAKRNGTLDKLYHDEVERRVEKRYTLRQELAIQRKRDTHPDEFDAYNAFVEAVKKDIKAEIAALGGELDGNND